MEMFPSGISQISGWINWHIPGGALGPKPELIVFSFHFFLSPLVSLLPSADFLGTRGFLMPFVTPSASVAVGNVYPKSNKVKKKKIKKEWLAECCLPEFQLNLETEAKWQSKGFLPKDLLIAPPQRQPLGSLRMLSFQGVLTAGW